MIVGPDDFGAFIASRLGCEPPARIEPGRFVRFPTNGKRGDDAGYAKLFPDLEGGIVGNFRTGESWCWQARRERLFTDAEKRTWRERIERERREAEALRARGESEAAQRAKALWEKAQPAPSDHPYLAAKRVKAHGLKLYRGPLAVRGMRCDGALIVPVRNAAGEIQSLEFIAPNGEKRFLPGGRKAGGYYSIGKPESTLCIAEGYGTAATLHEATGFGVAVAFDSGNLEPVARALRAKLPDAKLILCADNDIHADGKPNTGLLAATEAAQAVGGLVAVPEHDGRKCDFNDLAKERGAEPVQGAVANARAPVVPEAQPSTGNAPVGAEWPEPLPLPAALPSVDPFDPALLPEALRPWIEDVAERVQCPPEFAAVGAMISLAAVVGRRIGIRPKRQDDWLEVPNLWGAIIGRPGVMKSPALREAMRPLRRLEAHAREGFEEDAKTWRRDRELAKLQREATRSKLLRAARSDKPIDPNALPDEFSEDEPQPRRYVVNDTSHEALGVILQHNPNGVLAYRDELIGLLKSLDQEGNESARGFYLSAWNGTEGYTFDRIGRGLHQRIEACCLSLLGSIQPAVIGGYLRQAVAGAGDDGLLARFQLLVWPDVSGEWRDVDRWPDSESRKRAHDVFDRLDALDPPAIGATTEEGSIPFLRFDDPAQAMFSEWRAALEHRLRAEEEHPALESHLSKYRKLVPALALLCHLADRPGALVGEEALLKALAWAEFLEGHARRAYASVAQAEAESARHLLRRICKGDVPDPFTRRDVYLKHWACLATREEVADAARLLVDLDWLREKVMDDTGGRPKTLYHVNPKARHA